MIKITGFENLGKDLLKFASNEIKSKVDNQLRITGLFNKGFRVELKNGGINILYPKEFTKEDELLINKIMNSIK